MDPTLVHLHIPKAGGTSHRYYLWKVFGRENVLWFGPDFKPDRANSPEAAGKKVIGGHQKINFYSAQHRPLYTTVMRDPVKRAISFYKFRIASVFDQETNWTERRHRVTDEWIASGLDPTSLTNTIKNCERFRDNVRNEQCKFLSRYESNADGVLRTLREQNFLVGLLEDLPLFYDYFQSSLGFDLQNEYHANRENSHVRKTPADEEAVQLLRELSKEDQIVYDFVAEEHQGLYVNCPDLHEIKSRLTTINSSSTSGSHGEHSTGQGFS